MASDSSVGKTGKCLYFKRNGKDLNKQTKIADSLSVPNPNEMEMESLLKAVFELVF